MGALEMDGTPIPGPRMYTAKTYAYAYHLTKDSNMLIAAKRFAEWIKNAPPGTIETEATWDRSYS